MLVTCQCLRTELGMVHDIGVARGCTGCTCTPQRGGNNFFFGGGRNLSGVSGQCTRQGEQEVNFLRKFFLGGRGLEGGIG